MKFEEANGNEKMVEKIIARAVKLFKLYGVIIDCESWIKEVEIVEKVELLLIVMCWVIVKVIIGEGVEEEDKKRIWKVDAEECMKCESVEIVCVIYVYVLDLGFLYKKGLWMKVVMLEK